MPYMDSRNAERLVNEYADMILRISCMYLKHTHDAEDICQNVFLKLLSGDFHFDSLSHEKNWIIRTTINACKDHLRTAFWKRSADLDSAADIPADDIHAPERPDSELLELVMTLPENYRISIYLYYYEGYHVSEIASMLGKTENTISAYLHRGRKRLMSILGDESARMDTVMKGAVQHAQKF